MVPVLFTPGSCPFPSGSLLFFVFQFQNITQYCQKLSQFLPGSYYLGSPPPLTLFFLLPYLSQPYFPGFLPSCSPVPCLLSPPLLPPCHLPPTPTFLSPCLPDPILLSPLPPPTLSPPYCPPPQDVQDKGIASFSQTILKKLPLFFLPIYFPWRFKKSAFNSILIS